MKLISRIHRLFSLHGFMGGVTVACRYLLPSQRQALALAQDRDSEFDRKWGTDTGGIILPDQSEVVGPNWVHGIKYQGCNPAQLSQALSKLSIQHEHFTFIDFGSGKGRAVLVASRFPFSRIIGVDYSEQLNGIARRNVMRFPDNEKRCSKIDIVCADATRFPLPKGPLIIFLFNPFGKPLMTDFVRNTTASFQEDPRQIIVIYFNAVYGDVWKNSGFKPEMSESKWNAIYDTRRFSPRSG